MNDNVTLFPGVENAPSQEVSKDHNFIIQTISGERLEARGFLVFTPQAVAVMQDTDVADVSRPVLVVPTGQLVYAAEDPNEDN